MSRLVECKASKNHGFHPENGPCEYCPPPAKIFPIDQLKIQLGGIVLEGFCDGSGVELPLCPGRVVRLPESKKAAWYAAWIAKKAKGYSRVYE